MVSYYAVERSGEYLAHYGVKGMRWGVRRAKETGNERALDRHWRRANRKQNHLNKKANWAHQKQLQRNAANLGAGLGAGAGTVAGALLARRFAPPKSDLGAAINIGTGIAGAIPGVIVAQRAHKRMLSEGHQKALSESQAWTKEMNRAFQGTKYQGKAKKFNDMYTVARRVYQPEEARRGNAMPYLTVISLRSGMDLANDYSKVYGKKKRKRK